MGGRLLRRRELIAGLASAAALRPRAARAQKRRLVGALWAGSAEIDKAFDAALRRGLAEGGFVEGRNLAIAERYAGGDPARLPALASELAALKPGVIVAAGSISALAAHRAAPEVPVVAFLDGDPVALGLFRSYARPDAMVTGFTFTASNAAIGKQFEILRDLVPRLHGVGFVFSPDNPAAVRFEPHARAAAEQLGLSYTALPTHSMDEVKAAFQSRSGGVGAMDIYGSPLLFKNLPTFVDLSIAAKKPVMTIFRPMTERGFLVSYGPDFIGMWRGIGGYAAKILAGEKPADLPVQMPAKFTLVINLKTAKAIGLTVPPSILAVADEVIQ